MKRIFHLIILLLVVKFAAAQNHREVRFSTYANGKNMLLNDSVYTTPFGEKYSVSKLKYYISNIHFVTDGKSDSSTNVFLIDASLYQSGYISVPVPESAINLKGIEFLLGVDSVLNFSGAQEGALDPLNDMFWTWNNGYINFKLEGHSSSSFADQQRIEHHIGGYRDNFKTMRKVFIPFPYPLPVNNSFVEMISIDLNLDKYWDKSGENSISKNPVIGIPGALAVKAADHFPYMFSYNGYCCLPQ